MLTVAGMFSVPAHGVPCPVSVTVVVPLLMVYSNGMPLDVVSVKLCAQTVPAIRNRLVKRR